MPNHGTNKKKERRCLSFFFLKMELLTSYDSTHWASISASTAIQASVRVDLVDVTL